MAIGMIVPDFANVNYATIAQGRGGAAATAGYALLVAERVRTERLADLHGRIDGLLVGMATSETPRLGDFGGGVLALLVNRREPCGIASVTVDDEAGACWPPSTCSPSATAGSGTSPARRMPTPRGAACAGYRRGARGGGHRRSTRG